MKKWKICTPEMVSDYLPAECYSKRKIEDSLRKAFFLSGYDEVETPVYEYLDVFRGLKSSNEQNEMIKIVEAGKPLLTLRHDMTLPIARLAASKLKNESLPLRLSYFANVYRYHQGEKIGKQREIAQAGLELLGLKGPEADAEIIATAIEGLLALKIKGFQIEIGQVNFFKGLLEELAFPEEKKEKLRSLVEEKNILGLTGFLAQEEIDPELKTLLESLPRMYGQVDILEKIKQATNNQTCLEAIANLKELHQILKDYGLEQYISYDLGMVHSLDYYSGVIFKGFAKNVGYSICQGGRYDNLLWEFDYDIPATGIAIETRFLLEALAKQESLPSLPPTDILLVSTREFRPQAYQALKKLKGQNKRVELFFLENHPISPQDHAQRKKISQIITIDQNTEVEEFC